MHKGHLFQGHQERTINPSNTPACPKNTVWPFCTEAYCSRSFQVSTASSPDADDSIMNISPTHHHRQHQLTWNDLESLDQASVPLYEMVSFSLQWCQTSASPFRLS